MNTIYKKARAKINLNLLVLNKREDNYHNIRSIFQKISLYDELYIEKTDTNTIELNTNIKELNNEDNIIYKAYMKLKERTNNVGGVKVSINKKIPMEAGLAGGSTDCANFIVCMNKLFNLNLSKKEMKDIGKSLGADVVPCMYNTAIKAEGIGNIITKLKTDIKYYILIIKPKISFNTKNMYKRIDSKEKIKQVDQSDKIIEALESKKLDLLKNNMYNVFENVIKEKDLIKKLKNELKKTGAIQSLMTGAGSCVYGIFKDKQVAKKAYRKLKERYQTYICTSYNSKREEIL